MAKKKVRKKQKRSVKPGFTNAIDERVYQLFPGLTLSINQKMQVLLDEISSLKANLVATTSLLEKHGVLNKEEFFKEVTQYVNEEGIVDEKGMMDGEVVFTIYNMEAW